MFQPVELEDAERGQRAFYWMFSFPLLPVMGGIKLFMLLLLSSYALARKFSTILTSAQHGCLNHYCLQYYLNEQNFW